MLEGLTGEFYAWCKQGELRFQRCADCRSWRHVPREMCAECGSTAGNGSGSRRAAAARVFTWTVAARALHPAFADATPYAPVVVEMEEGVRLLSRGRRLRPPISKIDMPVEVVFDDVTPEVTLPKFKKFPHRRYTLMISQSVALCVIRGELRDQKDLSMS